MGQGLVERFLAARPDELAGDDGARLDAALAALIARGRARFGLATTADAELAARIGASAELRDAADPAAAVAALSDELVLTAACLAGDRGAQAVLERDYRGQVAALARSIGGDHADDVVQDVWIRLLVPRGDAPGRLADYGGAGSLLTWLRVVVAREAVSALRRRRDAVVDDEVILGKLIASQDPDLALVRARSAAEVKRAFEDAVAALAVRDRNLLRQHILDGLTIDDLGALYRVHRVTAARWLSSAREAVWRATHQQLRARLQLTPSELDSLLGEVRDFIDLSLERVFR